jgi:hypothetical protein
MRDGEGKLFCKILEKRLYILTKVAILTIKGEGNTEGGRSRQRREGSQPGAKERAGQRGRNTARPLKRRSNGIAGHW